MLYAFLQETHTHTNPSCSSLDASYMQIAKWCSFFDVAQSRILDVFYITAREGRKEGRVEEDYRQNFPSFLLPACISTFLSLSRQTGSLSVSFFLYPLYFPLSMLSYTSHSLSLVLFSLSSESKEASVLSQRKCRSSVFCDSPHTNTEEEMEMITSFSALSISPPLFHSPP